MRNIKRVLRKERMYCSFLCERGKSDREARCYLFYYHAAKLGSIKMGYDRKEGKWKMLVVIS